MNREGWKYCKLGDLGSFLSGYTPKKEELQEVGKYPYFKVGEMNKPGNEKYMKYTDLYVDKVKKFFPKGSIVFPKNGGAIFTEKKRILKQDSIIDLNTEAFVCNEKIISLDFAYLLFSSLKLSNYDNGGGLPSINIKKLSQCSVTVPSIEEQQRIVQYLDNAFSNIDKIKERAERQIEDAKGLFQASLNNLLSPKNEWDNKLVSEICRVINGRAYLKPEMFDSGKYRILRVGNFFTNDKWYYSNLELDEDKYCDKGDLLYAWSASFGPRIWDGEKVIYHYHIWKIVCTTQIDKFFLCYWLDSDAFKKQAMKSLHGATMNHITKNIMEKCIVAFPSLSIQQNIVVQLNEISDKTKTIEENCKKIIMDCEAMKGALLREVFE